MKGRHGLSILAPMARIVVGPPALAVLGLLAPLAGCGWAEWPPGERQSRPATTAERQVTGWTRPAAPLPRPRGGTIAVAHGDTVYRVARRYGVPMRDIIAANRLVAPYHLRAGQRLEIPEVIAHVVRPGDTLSGISQTYGVGVFDLARLNGLTDRHTILVGQRLSVPRVARAIPPVSRPATRSQPSPPARVAPPPARVVPPSRPRPDPPPVARRVPPPPPAPSPPQISVPRPPPRSGKGFLWPVDGKVIAGFGSQSKGLHNDGINIAAAGGTPVRATDDGVVAYAGNELRSFGNLLLIKHRDGWVSAYAHIGAMLVARGARVRRGQVIARVGSTGRVGTPQLHFELRRGKRAEDPLKHLSPSPGSAGRRTPQRART